MNTWGNGEERGVSRLANVPRKSPKTCSWGTSRNRLVISVARGIRVAFSLSGYDYELPSGFGFVEAYCCRRNANAQSGTG